MEKYIYLLIGGILLIVIVAFLFRPIQILIIGLTQKERIQKNITKECRMHDFLVLNDLLFRVNAENCRHIDTIIFGDKQIYVVKEVVELGKIAGLIEDKKWRVYSGKEMSHIDNPLLENRIIIQRLCEVTKLSSDNFVSMIALAKSCEVIDIELKSNKEYICSEEELVTSIAILEEQCPLVKRDGKTIEAIVESFYKHGIYCENNVKKKGRKR